METNQIDQAKRNILDSIHQLTAVAERRDDPTLKGKLRAQALILERLDERIDRSQLPAGFVRSIVNDVRLDTIMILADMKFALTVEKQIAAASRVRSLAEVEEDLHTLAEGELRLKSNLF